MKRVIDVLCFGSSAVAGDDVALQVAKKTRVEGVRFTVINSPERLLDYSDRQFVIFDAAKGIKKPAVLADSQQLEAAKLVSLHDFDAAFFITLMDRLGRAGGMEIFAVPLGYSPKKAKEALVAWLASNAMVKKGRQSKRK